MNASTRSLSTQFPVALFPVRLETRLLGPNLCIRVIPDTIHADSHEPELTDDELAAGQRYWTQVTGADGGMATAAWRALASQLGTERASWVARVVRQTERNHLQAFTPASRDAPWTRVAQARLLPARWTAVGWLNGEDVRATGPPIVGPVPVGPDPARGGLALPAWMRDFTTAEKSGMGLRLPLTPDMQQGGLDLLLVYGVDETADPAAGAQQLSDLLDAHYYTDGFGYIPAGTPTTNSATTASGLNRSAPAYIDGHRVYDTDQPPTDRQSGAAGLAKVLGIRLTESTDPPSPSLEWEPHIAAAAEQLSKEDPNNTEQQNWYEAQAAVLGGVGTAAGMAIGAGLTEETTAQAMNRALWAAGPGYYLSQMLNGTVGEDFKRPDHSNVIADDAYLRYLDRQRLLLQAQTQVIARQTGISGLDPADSEAFDDAWNAAISSQASTASVSQEQASAQLWAQVTALAAQAWQQIHPGEGFDATGDWDAAAQNLTVDRTARYAYYRWLARSGLSTPEQRLSDWLAGQTAALYGQTTFQAARSHFASHVRAGGAVPAIAIGDEPYGILVACALDDWEPAAGESGLQAFVQALCVLRDTIWTPAAAAVPQLGAEPISDVTAAQTTLLQLLAMSPLSQQIFAREHIGPDYIRNLWRFVQMSLNGDWSTTTAGSSAQLLTNAGIAWPPRLSGLIGAEASAALTAPLVDDGDQTFATWLRWLASPAATCAALQARADLAGKGPDTPLLYRLLRHSALREYADAAVQVELARGILKDWEHLEQELIAISPGASIATVWQQLARTIELADGTSVAISDYLDGPASATDPAAANLADFRAAVATLAASATADELERNLRQMIDSTSHRLDAWLTSIAHRRLMTLRAANPAGILVGGYGWVENLRPADSQFASDGFIHAPSVPQAVTAAVLRSGYQSYTSPSTNPFTIDLSSARTRLAGRLLDAVRAGQTLGSLTGYDFERTLQESGAGQYTRAFRQCAPPSATAYPPPANATSQSSSSSAGSESSATAANPTSVTQTPSLTDGLVLRNKWQDDDPAVEALLAQIESDDTQREENNEAPLLPVVTAALGALNDALDAAADALTAESLHHAINGVPSRAAATLDALARGDGTIPELDLLAGPRSGLTLAHRVAFVVAADIGAQRGWSAPTANQLRAAANPTLEALAQGWLPDPAQVRCAATFTPASGPSRTAVIRLSDCDISALDCVYETPAVPQAGSATPVADRIVLAVTEAAARQFAIAPTQPLTFTWNRTSDFAPAELTFGELASVCRLGRVLVQDARALRPADLAPIATPDTAVVDPDITARANATEDDLRLCAAALNSANAATRHAAIRVAANFGVLGAAYAATVADPDPALVSAIAGELQKRLNALDQLAASTAASKDVQRLQAAFGADFLPLPAFKPANASDLNSAATRAQQAGWADQPTIRTWLARCSWVRPRLGSLMRLRTATCALPAAEAPLAIVQLPAVPGEPWIGAPFHGTPPAGPRVQVTLANGPIAEPGSTLAGIVVDDWTETVAEATPTSGLAYHYQSPLSQPPQAVLVAVPADLSAPTWTAAALEQTLTEALALAKIRAVDQDALTSTGQLLPAFYIASNVAQQTVSTYVIAEPAEGST